MLDPMELSRKERKKLIAKISKASGVAQYALEAKMTDLEVVEAANNLKIFLLVKAANNYNRYCQGQMTAEANAKLKQFLDLKNSEIFQAGQWLISNLSKKGRERRENLLEKDLVHKENYNETLIDLRETIKELQQGNQQIREEASNTIRELERTIDARKKELASIKNYIISNKGIKEWKNIVKYFSLQSLEKKENDKNESA